MTPKVTLKVLTKRRRRRRRRGGDGARDGARDGVIGTSRKAAEMVPEAQKAQRNPNPRLCIRVRVMPGPFLPSAVSNFHCDR